MTAPLELVGKNFGRLSVISRAGSNNFGQARWKCLCSCGTETITTSAKLTSGSTRSCGCIKADRMRSYRLKRLPRQQCAAPGCDRQARDASGIYCDKHLARFNRAGRITLIRRENGTGNINPAGYVDICLDGRRKYEHIRVAEAALGKRLRAGAVVHHVNENRSDNRPSNLVICPDDVYHKLLHRRMKALAISGDANKLKCSICKKYDDPQNVRMTRKRPPIHPQCARDYANARYARSRG